MCCVGFPSFAVAGGGAGIRTEWLFDVRGIQKGHSFNHPLGIFLDNSQKKIYIADTDNREVAVFSLSGEPLGILRTERPLSRPLGVLSDAEGKIYISYRDKECLEIFDAGGKFLSSLPSPELLKDHGFSAGKFVLGPGGRIYAVNRKTGEIWVFERNGSLAFRFGGRGSGKGKFQLITDIFFREGKIYLSDSQGIPVQVFSLEGKYLGSFGRHGQHEEDFSFPQSICVDRHQRIWVVDAFRHRIKVYDQEGNYLSGFGTYGTEAGKFCFPVDLDFDDQDRIYILEKSSNRFQVFQIEGKQGLETGQGEKTKHVDKR
ncbi:MAG: 6-bladed beta-propeller [bacterium]